MKNLQFDKNLKGIAVFIINVFFFIFFMFFWNRFMRSSDFAWTVQQAGYWDAIVEMLGVFMLYFFTLKNNFCSKEVRSFLLIFIFGFFLYIHSFLWAMVSVAIYFLYIYVSGLCMKKILNKIAKKEQEYDTLFIFLFGFSSIIIEIALLSIFKVGTPEIVRVVFIIFGILKIILCRHEMVRLCINYVKKENCDQNISDGLNAMKAIVFTMVTFQCCRANMGLDYDSTWYGLRSEYILTPLTGIFDNIQMTAIVHTYSKGIEIISLPFSGLESYSGLYAINIFIGILTIYVIGKLCSKDEKLDKYSWLAMMIISIIPSIMNMTITVKADIGTLFFQILAIYYMQEFIKEDKTDMYWKAFSAIVVSYIFKTTSIIFSSILLLVLIIVGIWKKKKVINKHIMLIGPSIITLCIVWARTLLITGYPITAFVPGILSKIGIEAKYPYYFGATRMNSISDLFNIEFIIQNIKKICKVFLMPDSSLVTTEINWWGILFTGIWIISIIYILIKFNVIIRKMKNDIIFRMKLLLFVGYSMISLASMFILQLPDGNYFILLVAITVWFFVTEVFDEIMRVRINIMPLIIANLFLCFTISPSWIVGLTPIDFEKRGYYNHKENYIVPMMENNGAIDVYNYLESQNNVKLVAFTDKEEFVFALPAQGETFGQQTIWNYDTTSSVDNFQNYVTSTNVNILLIEKVYLETYPDINEYIECFLNHSKNNVYEFENYVIIVL